MIRRTSADPAAGSALVTEVRSLSRPLGSPRDLAPLLARVGEARVVLLGEASHGTHEFYTWRASITRRLIEEKGFSFVAGGGGWPGCDRGDRSGRGRPAAPIDPRGALLGVERGAAGVWGQEEGAGLTPRLRAR